jgi:hypothetical protein
MKMRYLWLPVLAIVSIASSALADFTVEPTEPSISPVADVAGASNTPVFVPSRGPFPPVLMTPPLWGPAIECNNFNTSTGYTGGFLFIPPDPDCAVGPTHVINISNVIIQWRPKAGIADPPQYENSLMGFFGAVPGTLPGDFGFDPQVIYDQYNGRFVVVFLQQTDPAAGDPSEESRICVAVSMTSDPNLGWYTYVINSKLNIGGVDCWADYPGVAVDDKGVYVTTNMFGFASTGSAYGGSRLWIINKVPTYAGGPLAFAVYDAYAATSGSGSIATTTQPTHMFGVPPVDGSARPLGTYLVSYSGLSGGGIEAVQIIQVSDPLGSVGGPFFSHQFVSVGDIDNTSAAMLDAPQLGTANTIETNDRRALNAVWRNNNLYLAAQVRLPVASPEVGQTTAHWWRFSTALPSPGIVLADQGNVGGEDLGAGTYTYYPAVMVDGSNNMAIGFSASNGAIYPGAYYATRLAADGPGSIGGSAVLALGVDYYNRRFGGARNRWGDYSGIAIDPADNATFYVYNEYAGPRGTILPSLPNEDGRWHTKLGWFQLQQTVAVAITKFDAIARDGVVSIQGEFRSDLGVEAVDLYRATGSGDFVLIETAYGATDRFQFTDRTVVAGTSYRYQIGVTDGEGEFRSPIVTVNVKEIGSSLAQNTPNPFNPVTLIRYQLSNREHVTLSVYDASGQLVRTLVDEVRPVGRNEVMWDGRNGAGAPVGSGVYFYRLDAGKYSESRKMVLLK